MLFKFEQSSLCSGQPNIIGDNNNNNDIIINKNYSNHWEKHRNNNNSTRPSPAAKEKMIGENAT